MILCSAPLGDRRPLLSLRMLLCLRRALVAGAKAAEHWWTGCGFSWRMVPCTQGAVKGAVSMVPSGGIVKGVGRGYSDFTAALREVSPSVAADSHAMTELSAWNSKYGDGATRSPPGQLSYYL